VESLDDRLDALSDEKEKMLMKMEALRSKDEELLDMIEDLQTPKEVITELDNKTKDVLDIREFFVRRANQLEERINQLDERAAPTRKMSEKVENLSAQVAEAVAMYGKLDEKFTAENKQFQELMKQHAAEKRKLEEKLTEQKARIGVLLKEFK